MDGPSLFQRANVEHAVQDVVAMGSVLAKPRWARIWHSVNIQQEENGLMGKGATAAEVIDETGIPQTTVYQDLAEMVDLGALEKVEDTDSGVTEYRTKSGHLMAHSGDPAVDEDYLTPVTIGVVGRAYENDDIGLFIERNGYNALHRCSLIVGPALEEEGFDGLADAVPEIDEADALMIEDTLKEIRAELDEHTLWDDLT